MPAGNLFGAPNGFIAATDERNTQAQTLQSIASAGHLGALTQQTQVQTARERIQLQQEQIFLQKLSQYDATSPKEGGGVDGDGNSITMAQRLDDIANMSFASGKVKDGGAFAKEASAIRTQIEQRRAAKALADQRLTKMAEDKQNDLYNWVSGATNEDEFNRGKMIYLARHPDAKVPPELETYDPAVVDYVTRRSKLGMELAKEKTETTRQEGLDRRHAETLAEKREHDAKVKEREIYIENLKQRHREMNKKVAGDKTPVVGMPPLEAVETAATMIAKDYPNLEADGKFKNRPMPQAAIDTASEAKALVAKNRGLSMTEAISQVYARKKLAGEFDSEMVPKKTLGITMGQQKRDTYRPAGTAIKTWQPGLKPERGVTYQKDGKYYQLTPDGKAVREVPKPAKAATARTPATTAEDDGEEDE